MPISRQNRVSFPAGSSRLFSEQILSLQTFIGVNDFVKCAPKGPSDHLLHPAKAEPESPKVDEWVPGSGGGGLEGKVLLMCMGFLIGVKKII